MTKTVLNNYFIVGNNREVRFGMNVQLLSLLIIGKYL